MVFLDTAEVEGGGPWSGNFVGMSWILTRDGFLPTLEGDPRFFFDQSKTPQAWGTGTEEWGGGGDYWGGRNMTLPFAGHPVGTTKKEAKNEKDLVNSAYRFLIADLFPFGNRRERGPRRAGLRSQASRAQRGTRPGPSSVAPGPGRPCAHGCAGVLGAWSESRYWAYCYKMPKKQ